MAGLREVTNAVKLGKARMVVISTNIEDSSIEGGLNQAVRAALRFTDQALTAVAGAYDH